MCSSGGADDYQWMSINEDSLFLHDGLIRVTDLIEPPDTSLNLNSLPCETDFLEAIAFDTRNPKELSECILALCVSENSSYARLLQYRLNALRGLWTARKRVTDERLEKESANQDEILSLLKKQGTSWQQANEQTPFSSRLSLLLLFPLLQSQSKTDPQLCSTTLQLLLSCLKDCPAHSLTKEPGDCLTGLENLLCSWLSDEDLYNDASSNTCSKLTSLQDKERAASAVVALTCARGYMKSFVNAIHLLQNLPALDSLPVATIVFKLLELEGGIGGCSSLLGNRHLVCWGFEDMLSCPNHRENHDKEIKEGEVGRSLSCDGQFLYTTNSVGLGLAKIGSGYSGTLRGFVYVKNDELGPGRVAFGNGLLLYRPHDFDVDKESCVLALVIDRCTLTVTGKILFPSSFLPLTTFTTIQFCSDGMYFYWLWCPGNPFDKLSKGQAISMDVFDVKSVDVKCFAVQKRVILQRKDESCNKPLNESLLPRLRRPLTTSLMVLSSSSSSTFGLVQEGNNSGSSSSCSVPLKTLLRSPIYVCGNFVVILTSSVGSSNNVTARSFFGSSSSLANLRSLATNLCFSVKDGLFVGRNELVDAPTCSLSRGAQLQGLGVCYDCANNIIWTCSNDWVDQFCNSGHLAAHHIYRRLGIARTAPLIPPNDDRLSRRDVICFLLQHVGNLCCNQLSIDDPFLGFSFVHQQQQSQSVLDFTLLQKVLDILDVAIGMSNDQMNCCILVVLQALFKTCTDVGRGDENGILKRIRERLWQLLTTSASDNVSARSVNDDREIGGVEESWRRWVGVQEEACRAICLGLNVLYPGCRERWNLIGRLVVEGRDRPALLHLRDLILEDFTEKLQTVGFDATELQLVKIDDPLLQDIFEVSVRESCSLFRSFTRVDSEEFELINLLPVASACSHYLSALQNNLLSEALFVKQAENEDLASSEDRQQQQQPPVMNFAMKVFSGAEDVLRVLLDVCKAFKNTSNVSDRSFRLKGLERVAKATILGQLLPVLLTSLTDANLSSLRFSDQFLSQLVRLTILCSRVAVLLKRRQDVEVAESCSANVEPGEGNVTSDGDDKLGFLSGLKVPTPWARGCVVESIHPVRDNYKFKETVRISGARCLYLRFDPRSSSQYDYDKLIVYAGPDTSSHKISEYGGNTFGYGSRSVIGSGWPKDLVKVDGDAVTFAFEMRSGREHNTPDKAMWGFLVSVRAQELNSESVSPGLPLMADVALGLSELCGNILRHLYKGEAATRQEEACRLVLSSRLMQNCVGLPEECAASSDTAVVAIDEDCEMDLASIESASSSSRVARCVATEVLTSLRHLSRCVPPQLRPSIRSVLSTDVLEAKILTAVLRLTGLPQSTSELVVLQQSDRMELLVAVANKTYQKLDALIRRLQALAEHEQRWQSEVEDIRQGMMPASMAFFADYHFSDTKTKELLMLCFLKDVDVERGPNAEAIVHELREKLEAEAYGKEAANVIQQQQQQPFTKTRRLVDTILQRVEILLSVALVVDPLISAAISSDVVVGASAKPSYSRSLSAPSKMEVSFDHQQQQASGDSAAPSSGAAQAKRLSWSRYGTSILDDVVPTTCAEVSSNVPRQSCCSPLSVVDQIFAIISCEPDDHIACADFLSAVSVRHKRGVCRTRSLRHMRELLDSASDVDGATHLVAMATSVLQAGPRIDDLTCSGMASHVREAFATVVTLVVRLASSRPVACCNSIALLCVVPYTKWEERCLVESGLVYLLDKLCSLDNHQGSLRDGGDSPNVSWKVAALAWASFQVLANCCVSWEEDDDCDEIGRAGLAQQVATLLTNHLVRATDSGSNDATSNEALQEVLGLLNNLSRSRMGRTILSQPSCISKLLSLLLDQRPSPKLVLIILQLCRTALPLMSADGCTKVSLPSWSWSGSRDVSARVDPRGTDVPVEIARLLLAKLGDYVIPGFQTVASSFCLASDDASPGPAQNGARSGGAGAALFKSSEQEKSAARADETDSHGGLLSVFVHKREDQAVNDIVQTLLGSESRLFRLGGGSGNVDRIDRVSRELTRTGKAEVCTEDAVLALRRAAKWAQNGMVVSTGPAVRKDNTEVVSDKKNTVVICKERNVELAKSDPVRVFISGQVANSMASEVIALLHGLLTATTARIWATAVTNVFSDALGCLPKLLRHLESIGTTSPQCNHAALVVMCRQVVATLCALGGFQTTLKPGCQVLLASGAGSLCSVGSVVTLCERQGVATVQMKDAEEGFRIIKVPLSRISPLQNEPLPVQQLSLTTQVIEALHTLFSVDSGGHAAISWPLPVVGEGGSLPMAICRIVAEMRTRACMVMAQNLRNDPLFAAAFVQRSGQVVGALRSLAEECSPSDRLPSLEQHCRNLRMLYRDCAKPPPPPNRNNPKTKEILWNTTKTFPPVRASLFSHGLTGITFLGDPGAGPGLPRGTFVYATQPVFHQSSYFYWELEVCSLGDPLGEDAGPVVSFGFAPGAERKDSAWSNPVGAVLFHNNGRAVHYNGNSLLQWRSTRLEVCVTSGDVAGCGWECQPTATTDGQPVRSGSVFFTYNGLRLPQATFDDVAAAGMWPVVHIQKKNTRVKANFGARPFAYVDCQRHLTMAAHDVAKCDEEVSATFGLLPFPGCSDSESDISERATTSSSTTTTVDGRDVVRSSPSSSGGGGSGTSGGTSAVAASCASNSSFMSGRDKLRDSGLRCVLQLSYGNLTTTGPDGQAAASTKQLNNNNDSDAEDVDEEQQQEDHYAMLVKAWESRVFPIIRRRFRNEAERRDGLEQIRGALQLGMTDIARQTVEFLYEENGGIPRDLHLPTIDDIRDEASRFTIDRVRKGISVILRTSSSGGSSMHIPKFAVHSMLRTFGLLGAVLEVDSQHELVQVETYLRSEGVLVRYWYPLDVLERLPQGLRKTAVTGAQMLDVNSIHIHRELLKTEQSIVSFYCRESLLRLVELGDGPGATSVNHEPDVENLQLLSDSLLSPSSSNGTVLDCSLTRCRSSGEALATFSCLASDLFYRDPAPLRFELASAIGRAASLGDDGLVQLADRLASCLRRAPESFYYDHVPMGGGGDSSFSSSKQPSTNLHFTGAAFLVVGCKIDSRNWNCGVGKAPWARVSCFGGSEVTKTGLPSRQEIVAYPRMSHPGGSGSDVGLSQTISDQYPSILVAQSRVVVKVGGGSLSSGATRGGDAVVTVDMIPAQFPLAVTFVEQLMHRAQEASSSTISPAVVFHAIEMLSSYLNHSDVPPRLKECLLHLLAELIRLMHVADDSAEEESPLLFRASSSSQASSCAVSLLVQLQSELRKVYEEETKTSGGSSEQLGRFSSYFHSLMEVSLAVAEAMNSVPSSVGTVMLLPGFQGSEFGGASSASSAASSSTAPPSSPSASTKRKKLKVKRDRCSPKSRSGSNSPRSSLCDVEQQPGPSASPMSPCVRSTLDARAAVEDMLWFHQALTVSEILRFLVCGRQQGTFVTNNAISDACQLLVAPTAHLRLLVVTGIPTQHAVDVVRQAIVRTLHSIGGVYGGDVFVLGSQSDDVVAAATTTTDARKCNSIRRCHGSAVVQIRSKAKVEAARKALYGCKLLIDHNVPGVSPVAIESLEMTDCNLSIATVNQNLLLVDAEANHALDTYLKSKLFAEEGGGELTDGAVGALTEIFHSCYITGLHLGLLSTSEDDHAGFICLSKEMIMNQTPGNLMLSFMGGIRTSKKSYLEQVSAVLDQYGSCKHEEKQSSLQHQELKSSTKQRRPKKSAFKKSYKEKFVLSHNMEKCEDKDPKEGQLNISRQGGDESIYLISSEETENENCFLTLDNFVRYVGDRAKNATSSVWQALFVCGYDLQFERCSCVDPSQALHLSKLWNVEMNCALVQYVNVLCRQLAITPARLHPHEICFSPANLSSAEYSCLRGVPMDSVRLQFALLQSLNNTLDTFFLSLVDLRAADKYSHSTAAVLAKARGMLFYDTKVVVTNRILNATAVRKSDQAAPEISLDPLENIGTTEPEKMCNTQFCQAMHKLSDIASGQFCVSLASGGDPTYAFNVRLIGEEVHGTSGSFRHFLSQISRELQSPALPLLMMCPNAAVNRNKGKFVVRPGPLSFTEERMLQFFGQILGITIRADIPLPIDLVSTFWKSLLGLPLDPVSDLEEVDVLTCNHIKEFDSVENAQDLVQLLEEHHNPHFVYTSLTGAKVELCRGGHNLPVCWDNHKQYVAAIRELRLKELTSSDHYVAIRAGLASIIPYQILHLMTPSDLQFRTCGFPEVNLDFLKAHTMYQVGLMETDTHIRYFWNALEGFSQDELCKFIKFASNQDRIPCTCPCRDGQSDTVHVPPYPMKIAPPEGRSGSPDSRFVRVETCMFMVKLPQYSSQEIMTERLLYAINCREDPLSG